MEVERSIEYAAELPTGEKIREFEEILERLKEMFMNTLDDSSRGAVKRRKLCDPEDDTVTPYQLAQKGINEVIQ